jgi:general stress protein 26
MAKNDAAPAEGSPKKLRKLIKDIRIAMLTTVGADGGLHSRPMRTSEVSRDGELWFITKAGSPKAGEIATNQVVNVTYADAKSGRYVALSGVGRLLRDPEKVLELWNGKYKAWFPQGKNDPDLAILQVSVRRAEYWDSATGKMVPLGQSAPAEPAAAPAGGESTGAGAQG